jgi:hypothetical protein
VVPLAEDGHRESEQDQWVDHVIHGSGKSREMEGRGQMAARQTPVIADRSALLARKWGRKTDKGRACLHFMLESIGFRNRPARLYSGSMGNEAHPTLTSAPRCGCL